MNTGRRRNRRRSGRFVTRLQILSLLLIVAAMGLFIRELVVFSQQEDQLPANISVGGIEVGGLSQAAARAAWEQTYAQPVTLYYNDSPILLDPASVGFRPNWQSMLAEAISVGESQGSFWLRFSNHLTQQELQDRAVLPLYADYQRTLLEQFLNNVAQRYDRVAGDPDYDVQTLTTFVGQPGYQLNIPQAMDLIDAALRDPVNRTVVLPVGGTDSDRPGMDTLRELIIAYLDSEGFIYDGQTTLASVFIMDLATGEEINLLGDIAYTAASTMKVSILIDYFRLISRDPTQDEAWLLANSLLCSRNSSSNLLMEIIGGQNVFNGLAQINQTIQYVGARNTFITAPFVEGVAEQQLGSIAPPETNPNPAYDTDPDPYNQTTAEDMGTVFTMLYDCAEYGSGLVAAFPDGEFNQTECRRMLNLMSANDLNRLLQGGIPAGVRISHKNGWLDNVVGDAGIVYPSNGRDYVISVYLWEDVDFQDFERLWPLVEGISRATWNYFNPDEALTNPRELPATAQDCEGNYLPPEGQVDLDNINGWR